MDFLLEVEDMARCLKRLNQTLSSSNVAKINGQPHKNEPPVNKPPDNKPPDNKPPVNKPPDNNPSDNKLTGDNPSEDEHTSFGEENQTPVEENKTPGEGIKPGGEEIKVAQLDNKTLGMFIEYNSTFHHFRTFRNYRSKFK